MTLHPLIVALALLLAANPASAQTEHHHPPATQANHSVPPTPATPATSLTEGEVRKIDIAQGKITLRHGPITHLDMPGMTMVFKASDASLLTGLQVGQRVRFAAEMLHGVLTVTVIHIQPAD